MEIVALLLATLTAGWAIFVWYRPSPANAASCCVFVSDHAGAPKRVVLVGPRGEEARTDSRGIGRIPRNWLGFSVSVRRLDDFREVVEIELPPVSRTTIKILVSE